MVTSAWTVLKYTGREVVMSGAFAGRSAGETFPVVSAVAKLVCEDGKSYAAYVHEALLDVNPAQVESLLSVHQSLRVPHNGIDDRARCERDVCGQPGLQCARFGSHTLPFFFDGSKCFYAVYRISEEELKTLPCVTLTDVSVPYEPLARIHSRRRSAPSPPERVAPWKQCLGFIPDHVVAKTLAATSQLVPSVEAETREVLARSVVRRRFASEEAPVVATLRSTPDSFVIYKSDGVTPLDDWLPSSPDDDQLDDIVPPDEARLPALRGNDDDVGETFLSDLPIGMSEESAFESSLAEVYGPSVKRPRFDRLFSLDSPPSDGAVVPQPDYDAPPEEARFNGASTSLAFPSSLVHGKSTPAARETSIDGDVVGTFHTVAASSTTDVLDDDLAHDPSITDPTSRDSFRVITQDQDIDSAILDEVSHQLI
ncbi:hypothetical protein MHU86_4087 [Fragilaria crotonensis]|nr:hypothetical protein MHU86_4087 [Fragilaria crotonensis]